MQIERVVIERRDGRSFCGVLMYSHHMRRQMLTWSFDVDEARKVILLLYPATSSSGYPEVQQHYQDLAGAIMDAIQHAPGPAEGGRPSSGE